MGSKAETKLQQANFLAAYLAHGDAPRAYKEAGYEGHAPTGAEQILRRPAVQAWLADAAQATAGAAISKVAEQTKDALQTRDGLTDWLVGVVRGDHTETVTNKDGDTFERPTAMKDRLKAADLLAKIQGFMAAVKVEATSEVFVFHTLDNARGGAIPATVSVVQQVGEGQDQDTHTDDGGDHG